MKLQSILLGTLLLIGTGAFAQLGKMQFEEAEQAYSEGKYEEAINMANEAEKTNKATNPLIMHLRIMARTELLKKDPEKDFTILDETRKEIKLFLEKYDGDKRVEDKYREVYGAYKLVKNMPATREQFNENIKNRKDAESKAAKEKKEKLDYFLAFTQVEGFKAGTPVEFYLKKYNLKRKQLWDTPHGYQMIYIGSAYIYIKGNKAFGYDTTIISIDDETKDGEKGKKAVAEKLKDLTEAFGFEPKADVSEKIDVYTWKSGNKTIHLRRTTITAAVGGGLVAMISIEHEENL